MEERICDKSQMKGRGSDRWWERRWWLWWGDMHRMRWTRRTVNRMRLTEWRRELIPLPQVRWCISKVAVGDYCDNSGVCVVLWQTGRHVSVPWVHTVTTRGFVLCCDRQADLCLCHESILWQLGGLWCAVAERPTCVCAMSLYCDNSGLWCAVTDRPTCVSALVHHCRSSRVPVCHWLPRRQVVVWW